MRNHVDHITTLCVCVSDRHCLCSEMVESIGPNRHIIHTDYGCEEWWARENGVHHLTVQNQFCSGSEQRVRWRQESNTGAWSSWPLPPCHFVNRQPPNNLITILQKPWRAATRRVERREPIRTSHIVHTKEKLDGWKAKARKKWRKRRKYITGGRQMRAQVPAHELENIFLIAHALCF